MPRGTHSEQGHGRRRPLIRLRCCVGIGSAPVSFRSWILSLWGKRKQVWTKLTAHRYRWPRWLAALVILGAAILGGLTDRFEVCEEAAVDQAGGGAEVQELCRDPEITDAAVVFAGIAFILLIAPDFEEIGLFGFALKRRVEQAEKKADDAEHRVDMLALRVQTMAVANASANVTINGLPPEWISAILTPEFMARVVEKVRTATPESRQGESFAPTAESPSASDVLVLRERLLTVAKELDGEMAIRWRVAPDGSEEPEFGSWQALTFLSLFREELDVVRAARKVVAWNGYMDPAALRDAVETGERLLALVRAQDHGNS